MTVVLSANFRILTEESMEVQSFVYSEKSSGENACDLTLDPNTANYKLILSEGNQMVTHREEQMYPDLPERFDPLPQVLCREALTGRCYWEVELSITEGTDTAAAVCYKTVERKRDGVLCGFGWNTISWSLGHKWEPNPTFYAEHDGVTNKYPVPPAGCPRLGVFLDWPAGTLSYYIVSFNKLSDIHTFRTKFSEPVFPAFKCCSQDRLTQDRDKTKTFRVQDQVKTKTEGGRDRDKTKTSA
ncbi:neoverrucotoxin subunit alpha-like [Archocentrus centrarchus]|uniref:neoverrucotoxin subunit alpha-like n=1 Tax=Archocentrus centrarchus TaxID=63155 RepID=UPI0011E9BF44|nr:neoverrucotoxin subunit alpha-like [Archocentrus centrarchus]